MDNEHKEDGGMSLQMSKIKKIIKLDPEHVSSTESANYVLGAATELFIKQLVMDASTVTKSKGRKKVMYDDIQKVVSSVDIYTFMKDIVPKTAPIGELLRSRAIRLREEDAMRVSSKGDETGEGEGREGLAGDGAGAEHEDEGDGLVTGEREECAGLAEDGDEAMEVDTVVDADAGSGERVHESGTTTDTGELTHRGAV
ncbi:uncharacterized protein C5L36_0B04960 [Pichia kudriavzevii]|uniref:Transcription factor CBF/NF-Y/archaeal histone domain-containing protein n=1 Tax=Pichia kudriavzevii TaxID=4909 RepID=A0A099P667_PICKU|nr:uncharacterized protein C5L36_0B04960 [Pichia kudriavzevii]AWU75248.1 hypothetical protein C5L36_0B04960 [Pichia kudriavzevii]KGK39764.1 hypothetical protein JL09_g1102 [Pichia kudriavzevii]